MTKFKIAKGPIRWGLISVKAIAAYTPWGTIYFLNEKIMKEKKVIAHELMHQKQRQREGLIIFGIKYLYYWAKKGWYNNPYEKEALKAAGIYNRKQYKIYRKKLRKMAGYG